MKLRTFPYRSLLTSTMVVLTGWIVLDFIDPPIYYAWKQQRMVLRVLGTEPETLRQAGSELLDSRPGFIGEIAPKSAGIPDVLRRLKPTRITFEPDSVWVDFSDVFNPFGIKVFTSGHSGYGGHAWIDGLWLFDDGQLAKMDPPWRQFVARDSHN